MVTVGLLRDHERQWAIMAWGVAGVGVVLLAQKAAFGFDLPRDAEDIVFHALVTVVAYGVAGAVLIDRRPDLPFGWLLAGVAAVEAAGVAAMVPAMHRWLDGDTSLAVRAGATGSAVLFLAVAVQGLINVRFPSGRPSSPAGRLLQWAIAASTGLALVGGVIVAAWVATEPAPPGATDDPFGVAPPGSTVGTIVAGLHGLVPLVVLLGLVAGIGVIIRYRRAVGIQRRQLAWRAAGVVEGLLLFPVVATEIAPAWLDAVDPPLFVATLAIPVLRHRLWSIDTIVRRSVVYGVVTAVLVAVYLALTALGTAIVSERAGALAAAAVVALAFAPLHARVQRLADRLAYGDRHDPYRTIRDLDRRLAEIAAPGEVLPAIVDTVGTSLRLPYVAIERIDGSVLAAHGHAGGRTERWPLVHEGTDEGSLVAAPRRGEDAFDGRDRALLADVARHAGVAVHAEALTTDLIASRQRLVAAREEERRRLRRDLHDGLGPTLTGIGLNLDAARARLRHDPDGAEQLVRDAKAATAEAIADVRHLVYGLRPPALDNLGLVGAIRRQADQLSTNGCQVVLEAGPLPELPAAVEVAAYRTVIEAITNSIRHGRAHRCCVRLRAGPGRLEIDIDDDGCSTGAWTPGVGLLSMREQTTELGGTIDAGPLDDGSGGGGGGRVRARYPLVGMEP